MRTYATPYRTARPEGRPLSASLLTCALALIVASGIVLAAPTAWHALTSDTPLTLARCAALSEGPDRLACYDRIEKDALRPPARGAFAVFSTR